MNNFFAGAVFLLASLTCLLCTWLLARSYKRSGTRLLLWSSLCFAGLTIDNIILFFDLIIFPSTDLAVFRHSMTLAGLAVLVFGLIWDCE